MIAFAAIAFGAFIAAMILNWRLVKTVGDERKDAFRRGYYNGNLDARLGRSLDWRLRFREEEDRENL
jgi:hypothetical protein